MGKGREGRERKKVEGEKESVEDKEIKYRKKITGKTVGKKKKKIN